MEYTFTVDTITAAAVQFWQAVKDKKVFAFNGEMGAGKTTFIQALCRVLGVSSPTGSPTFSIINQYSYPGGVLNHLDLYRLKDEEEAIRAGVEDCLYSGNICLVEWPEKAPRIFPADTVFVFLEPVDENTRRLRIADN
jgi:tRNA threonylcarbamoyladenosine biosynthesis protein TsaE